MLACVYHDLSEGSHLHDVLKLLVHVSEGELPWRSEVRGHRSVIIPTMHCWLTMDISVLTVFEFVNQLLVVVQFQLVHSVDQSLDVAHP